MLTTILQCAWISPNPIYSVEWSGSYFVAIDSLGNVFNSSDGITWSATTSLISGTIRAIAEAPLTINVIHGISRIQKLVPQPQSGISSIVHRALKTQDGISRIQALTTKPLTGKCRLEVTAPAQPIDGSSSIFNTTPQSTDGSSSIFNTTPQTIDGNSRLQVTVPQSIDGNSRIQVTVPQIQLGISRLQVTAPLQFNSGISRIQSRVIQPISGQSRIYKTTPVTIQGKTRILVPAIIKDIVGQSSILLKVTEPQSCISRIQTETTCNLSGRSRVQQTVTITQTGHCYIIIEQNQTQSGVASIYKTTIQTMDSFITLGSCHHAEHTLHDLYPFPENRIMEPEERLMLEPLQDRGIVVPPDGRWLIPKAEGW